LKELLKRLSEAKGPSGGEEPVRKVLQGELKPYVDKIEIDRIGNLISRIEGREPDRSLMISAHMDEIGLKVDYVEENGLVRFLKIGLIDDRILAAQSVEIVTRKGGITGIIGMVSPHLLPPGGESQTVPYSKLFIDVGERTRKDVEKLGVQIGDNIVFKRLYMELGGDHVVCNAVDNRASCAAMVEMVKLVSKKRPQHTIYAVATVQEEVGFKGIGPAAYKIYPDAALVLDVTPVHPDEPKPKVQMSAGPVIRLWEQSERQPYDGVIADKKISESLIGTAERRGIPYQLKVASGVTEAVKLHLTREGIPTCTIQIPASYIHQPCELVNINDIKNTANLLASFVSSYK